MLPWLPGAVASAVRSASERSLRLQQATCHQSSMRLMSGMPCSNRCRPQVRAHPGLRHLQDDCVHSHVPARGARCAVLRCAVLGRATLQWGWKLVLPWCSVVLPCSSEVQSRAVASTAWRLLPPNFSPMPSRRLLAHCALTASPSSAAGCALTHAHCGHGRIHGAAADMPPGGSQRTRRAAGCGPSVSTLQPALAGLLPGQLRQQLAAPPAARTSRRPRARCPPSCAARPHMRPLLPPSRAATDPS